MRITDDHTHTCPTCRTEYDCGGELKQNFDGWPEVVCTRYHLRGDRDCEACEARDGNTEDEDFERDRDRLADRRARPI